MNELKNNLTLLDHLDLNIKETGEMYYYCTKHIKVKKRKLIELVDNFIINNDELYFTRLIEYLRLELKTYSLNTQKLRNFLGKFYRVYNNEINFKDTDGIQHRTNIINTIDLNVELYISLFTKFRYLTKDFGEVFVTYVYKDILAFNQTISCLSNRIEYTNSDKNYSLTVRIIYDIYKYIHSKQKCKYLNNIDKYVKTNINNIIVLYNNFISYYQYLNILNNVNHDNDKIELKYFINKYYTTNLYKKNIKKIGVLKKLFDIDLYIENAEVLEVIREKLKELTRPLESLILDNLKLLIDFDKNESSIKNVVLKRLKGFTLEEIGKELGLTRERVRQIEASIFRKMELNVTDKELENFLNYVKIYSGKDLFISLRKVKKIFQDEYYLFDLISYKYRSKNVIEETNIINGYNISKISWVEDFTKEIEKWPTILSDKKVKHNISKFQQRFKSLNKQFASKYMHDILMKIVKHNSFSNNNVFIKHKLTKKEKYEYIIRNHFIRGFKLYDDVELKKFKKHYIKTFQDNTIYEDKMHSVSSIFLRLLARIDEGVYVLFEKIPDINNSFEMLINEVIDFYGGRIWYQDLYNYYKENWLKNGISNRYVMHSSLRKKFPNTWKYTRDYLYSLDFSGEEIDNGIINELSSLKNPFNITEINDRYPSVSELKLYNMLMLDENFLSYNNKRFFSLNNVTYEEADLMFFKKVIDQLIQKEVYVHVEKVFDICIIRNKIFIEKNFIDNPQALYSCLRAIFKDTYNFSRPFIANKNIDIPTRFEQFALYMEGQEYISLSELKKFIIDRRLRINSINNILFELKDKYILVDDDLIVKADSVGLTQTVLESIKNIISSICEVRGSINTKAIKKFHIFPKLNFEWNIILLNSILKNYFIDTFFIEVENQFLINSGLVITKKEEV